ncbi:MAG: hypothetical protein AB7N76_25905 [Planctomycetota bacterium]
MSDTPYEDRASSQELRPDWRSLVATLAAVACFFPFALSSLVVVLTGLGGGRNEMAALVFSYTVGAAGGVALLLSVPRVLELRRLALPRVPLDALQPGSYVLVEGKAVCEKEQVARLTKEGEFKSRDFQLVGSSGAAVVVEPAIPLAWGRKQVKAKTGELERIYLESGDPCVVRGRVQGDRLVPDHFGYGTIAQHRHAPLVTLASTGVFLAGIGGALGALWWSPYPWAAPAVFAVVGIGCSGIAQLIVRFPRG